MKPIWIELVDKGVANRFSEEGEEIIEMNWRLNQYPDLQKRIIKHEMGHEDGRFKFKDLIHDMSSRTPGLFNFMANNASAWHQLLPFYYRKKKKQFVYDWSSIISWIALIVIAYITFEIVKLIFYFI